VAEMHVNAEIDISKICMPKPLRVKAWSLIYVVLVARADGTLGMTYIKSHWSPHMQQPLKPQQHTLTGSLHVAQHF
jgi:hypothetical protein